MKNKKKLNLKKRRHKYHLNNNNINKWITQVNFNNCNNNFYSNNNYSKRVHNKFKNFTN